MTDKNPHAQALGSMTSPAKKASSAENGKRGGRPIMPKIPENWEIRKAESLGRTKNQVWVRLIDYPDGSRSQSYFRTKIDAALDQNQVGGTTWVR